MNFRCKSICSCSCIMHMVNLKFDFNHLTVQKWIRNTKILHSNSLISLLIRSGLKKRSASRAIGMNSGYHVCMLLWLTTYFLFEIVSYSVYGTLHSHCEPILINIYIAIHIYRHLNWVQENWKKQLAFTFVFLVCSLQIRKY